MCEKENGGGICSGILLGTAIGIALGMLYAPKAGSETRAMLKEKAEEFKDRGEVIMEEARQRAKKIIEDARGTAAEIVEKGQE